MLSLSTYEIKNAIQNSKTSKKRRWKEIQDRFCRAHRPAKMQLQCLQTRGKRA